MHEKYQPFLESILEPSLPKALEISKQCIKNQSDIRNFWLNIILPSLYEVGKKWQEAEITVGEEHTATSICQRVMSEHYDLVLTHIGDRAKILVTVGPNELHQIGARMLADMLEIYGYDVFFYGKALSDEFCKKIKDEGIRYILISSTIITNIDSTRVMIEQLRRCDRSKKISVIIGGQAYLHLENPAAELGADYCIHHVDEVIDIVEKGHHNDEL